MKSRLAVRRIDQEDIENGAEPRRKGRLSATQHGLPTPRPTLQASSRFTDGKRTQVQDLHEN